ncbi:peptide MFS transporter [Staphylococcus hyicus]|uniref:Peptide MFS transporter n=2 Tax=Staphylococcus hyicus TaxID=1284 RepID=A0ACD5FKZ6_STAHY|nr:peptide MFS transporter [Staphylococcus hyicus]MDP4448822.1 peptide MFS transporter [Staphylococcus hyicus]MDP4460199.1 peptide MFS transporter [Staphylococcus hyicus]MDP4463106.1 peptide MFS transporter [Staphylococcus hyicus]MDP4467663.1 peptide MFS transporter [Staphylococcus hyicus]MDY3698683.1 peptide MFS transporter [Staphylococcus hyicus]
MNQHYSKEEILASTPRKGFFGHPKGLSTLFFTEFWERFSYYGMRAILAYYIYYSISNGGFGLDQGLALQIVSIYGALIYMSGVIGGWIADRVTGTRQALFYGGVLIMLGHILLSLPNNFTLLLVALLFLIIGTGLLKPNISSTVGLLYDKNDPRLDAAFTIFYMSINLGALLSPLLVGWTQANIGFHLGFAIAAVGMFIGLLTYLITNKKNLGVAGLEVPDPLSKEERIKIIKIVAIVVVVVTVLSIILANFDMMTLSNFANLVTILGVAIPLLYFAKIILSKKTKDYERKRVFAYFPLFIASVAFWMIQEQGSTVLAQFADTKTQLSMAKVTGGLIDFHIPPAWFQSLNPFFIVLLAPLFSILWVKLGRFNPPTVLKFAIGVILAGVSYFIMVIPLSSDTTLINPFWLIASFLIVTLGELCISPIGLSTTTKLAPEAFTAQMMSIWFLSNAMAQGLNAQMVEVYTTIEANHYFMLSGIVAIVIGLILILISPMIKKLMHGVK